MSYPFNEIEKKWQEYWASNKTFEVHEDTNVPKDKRAYVLDMFPYPSAAGLHVGHPEGYTATDIYCRYLRMNGYNVLHPMGFDSFGLPAENYAIKTGTHPALTTKANIDHFRQQIKALGFSYDWSREVSTSDVDYYKWTQWIFLQLYKKGLAYESHMPINWCPSCKTGLANEEVKEGKCERCGATVTHKNIRQWVLKITAYAQRLLDDLDELDWPENVKIMQRNWIGKSTGAEVRFTVYTNDDEKTCAVASDATAKEIIVYTTRCDTLFGATYMVLSPEHPMVESITTPDQKDAVQKYIIETAQKNDLQRTDLNKDKTGVFTGSYAINPVNNQKLPIYIADYVLMGYGTGAIMAVPAHDERDYEFAKKFNLPIISVLKGGDITKAAFTDDGVHINSEFLNGLNKEDAISKMLQWLTCHNAGKKTINYKLRDWIFSRQRYWGEPIPLVHCKKCGVVPLNESDLPLKLPDVKSYQPTGTGESPLAAISDWVNCKCPKCNGDATRETNTMPQWAGSCWYYLRYLDPNNNKEFCSKEKEQYWMPVNLYVGGVEHAVLHLLYARFWHKVLFDLGLVSTSEPFHRLVNQGMITSFAYQRANKTLVPLDEVETHGEGEDAGYYEKSTGEQLTQVIAKMSKSLKNVVNPDDEIAQYGADSVRMYEMFMGPLVMSKPWSTKGITGIHRFLNRIWDVAEQQNNNDTTCKNSTSDANNSILRLYAQTVKKVTQDTQTLNFNTAISQMMIFINTVGKNTIPRDIWEGFVKILSPYAPHLSEELWQRLGHSSSIAKESWPIADESVLVDSQKTIVVTINGKVRGKFDTPTGTSEEDLRKKAQSLENVQKFTAGKNIIKCVIVKDKIVNFVVK